MADQPSVDMLAFIVFSKIFTKNGPAQVLSSSVTAFASFMREYMDPVVNVGQCPQYVDDNGIAVNNATELNRSIRAVFKCNRQVGLKLKIENWHFGVRQFEFFGTTILPEFILPQVRKFEKYLCKLIFPKSKKPYSVNWDLPIITRINFSGWF